MKRKNIVKILAIVLGILLAVLGAVILKKDDVSQEESKVTEQTESAEQSKSTEQSDVTGQNEANEEEAKESEDGTKTQELMTREVAQELVKNKDGKYQKSEEVTSGEISVEQFIAFSGQYVEDGRDELVEGVASILVKNNSDKFLDLAILVYGIGDETGTFVISSLPAGKSAWVMEKSRLIINSNEKFKHEGSTTTFSDEVISSTKKLKITSDGNMLTVKNESDKTMKNVTVYYKVKHDDGNYFGGITYMVAAGDLKAGQAVEKLAGHYSKEKAEIVKISWQ